MEYCHKNEICFYKSGHQIEKDKCVLFLLKMFGYYFDLGIVYSMAYIYILKLRNSPGDLTFRDILNRIEVKNMFTYF